MAGGIPIAERQSFSKRPGHIETGTDLGKYPAIGKEFERLTQSIPGFARSLKERAEQLTAPHSWALFE